MWDQASNFKRNERNYNPYGDYRNVVQQIWEGEENDLMELFMNVQDYIGCEMLSVVGDLCRISSWGINSEGYFTIVDYGLDDDVFDNFYRRRV